MYRNRKMLQITILLLASITGSFLYSAQQVQAIDLPNLNPLDVITTSPTTLPAVPTPDVPALEPEPEPTLQPSTITPIISMPVIIPATPTLITPKPVQNPLATPTNSSSSSTVTSTRKPEARQGQLPILAGTSSGVITQVAKPSSVLGISTSSKPNVFTPRPIIGQETPSSYLSRSTNLLSNLSPAQLALGSLTAFTALLSGLVLLAISRMEEGQKLSSLLLGSKSQ